MISNNQTNKMIKWVVTAGDFALLNIIIVVASQWYWQIDSWTEKNLENFILINNIALIIAQLWFSTIVHKRMIRVEEVIQRIIGLTLTQLVVVYSLLKMFDFYLLIGWLQYMIGTAFFALLALKRWCERWIVKRYRKAGQNTRMVTLIGSVPELLRVYEKLQGDPTQGYNVLGYYADPEIGEWSHLMEDVGSERDEGRSKLAIIGEPKKLGSLQDFMNGIDHPDDLMIGDEVYLCVSRRKKNIIRRVSQLCDHKVKRFFYVPVSVESIGLNLKSKLLDDIEIYTTYQNPLLRPINKAVKRIFDIVFSLVFLIPTAIIFPFIWAIIKIQSPGPIFFRQKRTGIDGKDFEILKFRSMHVNADADKLQATKDDPRKFPFGNFMRKTNIDELPQFWNVLEGSMSIVGPRPHMLAHTKMYSELIDKYMVRHFVKPGITGWAQVTGFRGETKELWQMEGRIKRDIWYIEHWSIWFDIRIIWITFKEFFIHEKNAY